MGRELGSEGDAFVVVPHAPGPLLAPASRNSTREPDDLDDLIDELFPDTDETAGWFDVALLVVGAGLLAWGILGDGPTLATVAGVVAVALGCILPLRAVGRRVRRRAENKRRAVLLSRGLPLRTTDATVVGLVAAYERLVDTSVDVSVAAGHGAVLEVASLLRGRPPTSEQERSYIERRSAAIEELVAALEVAPAELATHDDGVAPTTLVEAREELDELSGTSSLGQLADLTEQARAGNDPSG